VWEAEADEGGAIAEPGEGEVEPVVDAVLEEEAAHPPRRLTLGHPGLEPGGDGLGTAVGEALDLAEAVEVGGGMHHGGT